MDETAADMSDKFINAKTVPRNHDDLRSILTSPVMYCAVPDKVLAGMMYAEMAGMWFKYGMTYPVGGSGAIAHHLADFIERQGGHILLNANVDQITVSKSMFSKPTATGVSALVSGDTLPPKRVFYR